MSPEPSPSTTEISPASFRDPSGFVFRRDGVLYRQVNRRYARHFAALHDSGLYDELVERGLLVAHERVETAPARPEEAAAVLRPEPVPFISYPYEWCFGQLRAAALATLEIQQAALAHGMVLKDASAFNVQFVAGRPRLIDTLSFEVYEDGQPWVAYRQFCEHFLAPLLLIRDVDPALGRLPALTAGGVPLETASGLLPLRTRLSPTALLHIHLHARSIRRYGGRALPERLRRRGLSRKAMGDLVEGLREAVRGLRWEPEGTEWAGYAEGHGYDPEDYAEKQRLVAELLEAVRPAIVWDLGANTGQFSRIASRTGASVVSADSDHGAVERNYREMRAAGETRIHPLWVDLLAPSPRLGWAGRERDSLGDRAAADLVLALALVHHLAISGNVPLGRIAEWLASLGPRLVIEFVPRDDPQVRRLLVSREDVFDAYSQAGFEAAFGERFETERSVEIGGSGRRLYLLRRREA